MISDKEIKKIVSEFLNKPVDQIDKNTRIDRHALGNSIKLHQMFAALSSSGIKYENYLSIETYGQLLNSGQTSTEFSLPDKSSSEFINKDNNISIGIDIEEVANLNAVYDYREDEFYKNNFSPSEISYCVLQSNPVQSFCGLFAAKESFIKLTQSRISSFKQIEIEHTNHGKPYFKDYKNISLSISHTDSVSIAVSIKIKDQIIINGEFNQSDNKINDTIKNNRMISIFSILALLFSLFALLFSLKIIAF